MAAWHEASGADPEYLPTDRPSAVSENDGDKSRLRKRTCRQRYQGMADSLVHPRKHPLMPRGARAVSTICTDCLGQSGGSILSLWPSTRIRATSSGRRRPQCFISFLRTGASRAPSSP
jgi:hypothetical protein